VALCHEATAREVIDNDEGGDVGGRHDRLHTPISEEVCRQQRLDDGL
jgi:hypothetical protein